MDTEIQVAVLKDKNARLQRDNVVMNKELASQKRDNDVMSDELAVHHAKLATLREENERLRNQIRQMSNPPVAQRTLLEENARLQRENKELSDRVMAQVRERDDEHAVMAGEPSSNVKHDNDVGTHLPAESNGVRYRHYPKGEHALTRASIARRVTSSEERLDALEAKLRGVGDIRETIRGVCKDEMRHGAKRA